MEKVKKLDRRVKKTKKSIRKAFILLIDKKDLNDITITELSHLADIDRKTFYLHYETINDVYKEIEIEVSTKLHTLLNSDKDFTFQNFFLGLNKIMQDDLNFYKVISKKPSYSFLLAECTELLNQKLIEKYPFISPTTSSFISHGIIGTYVDWLNNNNDISLESLAIELGEILEKRSTYHF